MSSSPGTDYAKTAVSGIKWQGLAGIAIRIMRSLVFLLLARLIVPEAFGLVALATVFTAVLRALTGGGFSLAIVQQPNLTRAHLDTAFAVSVSIGALLSALLAVGAGLISGWMNSPSLEPVLLGLSAMPLLAGVSAVPEGLLSREMKFRQLSIRHLVAAAASTGVALVLALLGAGVWALVAQTLVEAVISCVALWISVRRTYLPGRTVSRRAYRELSHYGYKVLGGELTQMVSTRADDFLVGAVLGTRALGVYSVGYRLLTILQETMQGVSSGVAFPLYAKLQSDPERLARGFRRAAQLNYSIAAPVFVYTAAAASPIVSLTLGDRWLEAAPVMTALAISGVASLMTDMNNILLSAKGFAGRVLALSLGGAVLNLAGFAVAVQHGIVWVAVAFALRAYLLVPVSFAMVAAHAGGSRALLRTYVPLVSALMAPLVGGAFSHHAAPEIGSLGAILVGGVLGAGAYVLAVRAWSPACFADLVMIVTGLVRRRGSRLSENG